MIVKPIIGGMFGSISYLVGDKGKALLIDAGVNCEKVISAAKELKLNIEKIILTHGHIDHIVELDNIVDKTNAKVYIHIDDELALRDGRYNVSAYTGEVVTFNTGCEILRDGSIIKIGDMEFKVIHTPGHTPGSICVMSDDTLFSGDTLFNGGYGRVDLPNGSFEYIYQSIMNKLFILPDNIVVYPGHGESTIIEREKKTNPIKFANEW